ncbi:hypothetical protein DPEC_G00311290 [Dallia pectoralis]|uniref:Uncharacterized protein n=1 Tax=Dallia pectoralis TaxID=75939 RepID=A0ACC2FBE8_DALPE|nr:hypothetical protein DPEC_G00311290 [Dallia pectoralis]
MLLAIAKIAVMSMEELISVHFEIFGRVQGVFFRKYTQAEGKKLGLVGWVKNTKAGTVQGQLQGPKNKQCVEELIVNSIDAGATCVGVRVDVEAFKVQVVDNGFGMDIGDMEHVGKRYFTSKCSSLEDMGNLKFYGFRGEALASIATLAMVVEISSRTKMSGKTHVKILKEGKSLDVFEAENTRPSAGTTVIICNLFYNMPVRRKRMDSMLEFERVRQRLEAVSLMHPSVSFSLKNDCTGTMVMQLSKAQNTYYRFVQIYGLGRAQKLAEIGHSHAQFEVSGYIGKKGHYNNTLQFLFVNDRLLLKTRIHKLLNLLLRKVGSSTRLIDSPGTPAVRSPQRTRGAELHAMYVINIKCHYSEYDICFEPAKTLIEFKVWESLLACIEETVKAFLNRENLRYELSPEDIQDVVSQNVFSVQTASTDRDINDKEKHNDTSPNLIFIPSCNTKLPLDEQEESNVRASSDWLHHYDAAVGKLVYVNQVTGLSKYAAPPAEETQVPCTSDVTNMAISVISKNGVEYRCYPFPMNLVLPFLPKSKPGRGLSSGLGNGDGLLNPNSLSTLYSAWTNPVFARPPMIGVDISSGQAEGLAVKIHNILFPYRFSKDMIQSMKVIQQVDKKFLACLINTQEQETATCSKTNGNLLVLVDQHAAHERVRLENLIADSYEDNPDAVGERRLCSSTVTPPLEVSLTQDEQRLLRSGQTYWRALGLEMQFSQTEPLALVRKVPVCFTEKESNEFRRGRQSVIKAIVEEYLQEQIESLRSTGRVIGTLPLTVLKVLASIACHGAVKFNDHLSKEECCSLVCCLSSCQLPFQCAHGRPSIAPLVDILHLNDQEETPKPNLRKLRRMRKAWIIYGNTH